MTLIIHTIPAFQDNYLWLFHQSGERAAFVVDPGDAQPVLECLARHDLELAGILITHHHPDHTGGIKDLLAHFDAPVYGPNSAHIPQITQQVGEGDRITLAGARFSVLEIPGHTLDHIAYHAAPEDESPLVFCGDTLFSAGCGRLFEGSPEQMHQSLQKLAALPDTTQIYCAHEYTLSNLAFATAVEPDSKALQEKTAADTTKRQQGLPTVPSTLSIERETNPFLRCHLPTVVQAAMQHSACQLQSPAEVLREIRLWKDNF
ncbi:hydroxyacylglutathione hydrolase [Gammaproteobacteria bacterium 53_120_T64]|nr:hydroxyacylglutathione hydrolase [Gammaproteobacteria bacterium 53_120_T64]